MKRTLIGLALLLASTPAWATECATLPVVLSNGTIANADQVMADLNCLASLKSDGTFNDNIQIKGGAIGINRRTYDGAIYNPSIHGFQFTHYGSSDPGADQLKLQVYSPSGAQASTPWSVDGYGRMAVNNSGTNVNFTFYVNGFSGGNAQWNVASDERLKTNIRDLDSGLATVMKLRPVRYSWKGAADRAVGKAMALDVAAPQIGFLAQEVAAVVPEAVHKPSDSTSPYMMSTADLIPYLVQAVKEQQAQITMLEAKIAALTKAQ